MADVRYYVSQQHGNDNNTGLSAAQAWATLTKAAQTVDTPPYGYRNVIHWGPGTYRERIYVMNDGLSEAENIVYAPDPNCLWLTGDNPGRCRITGCNTAEMPTSGAVVDCRDVACVQYGTDDAECWVDGSSDGYAVVLGKNCVAERVNALGYHGFYGGMTLNCCATAGVFGFEDAVTYNCSATAGGIGFYGGDAYNCIASAGQRGYDVCQASNCIAVGCYEAFSVAKAFNCYAAASSTGFSNCAVYACTASLCDYAQAGSITGDGTVSEGALVLGRMGDMPWNSAGMRQKGWWIPDTQNVAVAGTPANLSQPRMVQYTPSQDGFSAGVAVHVASKSASGYVTCELQVFESTWTTVRSKTISVSSLVVGKMNRFEWDDGSYRLDPGADSCRYLITADVDAQSTTIGTSNGTKISYQGFYWPTILPFTDSDGRPRCAHGAYPSIGPWEPPGIQEEWTTYKTAAPAIKLTGNSMHIMKAAAAKDNPISVKWWVRHHGTDGNLKPQVCLRGLGLTTQTATCTAAADTWEQVSVSITPARDTVLDVCLYARDPATGAYAIFFDPEVS